MQKFIAYDAYSDSGIFIDGFVEETGLSKTFIGIMLLPIVGNAVEHLTAISMAIKNKMDLTLASN